MKHKVLLLGLLVLFLLSMVAIFYPDYDTPHVVKFLIVSQILFGLSLGIYFCARRLDLAERDRRWWLIVFSFAFVARLVMLWGPGDHFYLSDDIYRYIWEGKLVAHGINPFALSPDSEELESLRDEHIYPNINHPYLPTIYPPLAQSVFASSYVLGGDATLPFKLICVCFELVTIVTLWFWLPIVGARRVNLMLYLFSPLVLIEFYLSAHVDIVAMPFLVGAFIALGRKRPGITGLFLALATLVKFYGLFFAPFLFFHFHGKRRALFSAVYVLAIITAYLPFLTEYGGAVLGSLADYLTEWQFNASVFAVLQQIIGFAWARNIVGAAFLAWIIYLLFRRLEIHRKLFRVFAGYLVLTTTFFPWYFVWLFPGLLRNLNPAYLALSGLVLLSYHVHIGYYATGEWSMIPWLTALAYVPFYVLLLWRPARVALGRG